MLGPGAEFGGGTDGGSGTQRKGIRIYYCGSGANIGERDRMACWGLEKGMTTLYGRPKYMDIQKEKHHEYTYVLSLCVDRHGSGIQYADICQYMPIYIKR